MKRFITAVIACVAASTVLTGCGQKKADLKTEPEGLNAESQKSENYEDALKECFNASFSLNGGKVFYSYMYPDEYIEDMKSKNEYDEAVNQFNHNQEQRPDLTDGIYEFGTITESKEITEKQREAVKLYFAGKCDERGLGLTKDDFTVGDGYEVSYTYTKDGKEEGSDLALAVVINDQGWKVIPS